MKYGVEIKLSSTILLWPIISISYYDRIIGENIRGKFDHCREINYIDIWTSRVINIFICLDILIFEKNEIRMKSL